MAKNYWDRMADESPREYFLFAEYFLTQEPPNRTTEEAWRRYRTAEGSEKPGPAQPHFKHLAKKMDWQGRAGAYDEHLAAERRKAREQEIKRQEKRKAREHEKLRDRYAELEEKLIERAISLLDEEDIQRNLGHAGTLLGRGLDIRHLLENLEARQGEDEGTEGDDLVEEFLKEVRTEQEASASS